MVKYKKCIECKEFSKKDRVVCRCLSTKFGKKSFIMVDVNDLENVVKDIENSLIATESTMKIRKNILKILGV